MPKSIECSLYPCAEMNPAKCRLAAHLMQQVTYKGAGVQLTKQNVLRLIERTRNLSQQGCGCKEEVQKAIAFAKKHLHEFTDEP